MRTLSLVATLAMASLAFSQDVQLGTVTSSAPFQLRGATLTPGRGVPSWPVMAGDTIKAGTSQAMVVFTDGSLVSLQPGSTGVVTLISNNPTFRLLAGSAMYSLKNLDSVTLMADTRVYAPPTSTGSYDLGSGRKAAGGFWTAGHTTIVAGAAVGAATGIALGVASSNSSGGSVSPSR